MPLGTASDIEAGSVLDCDVCVVGAGPAGLALGHGLRGTGARVIVLESGGARPSRRPQSLSRGEIVGLRGFPLAHSQVRSLGGSTTRWGGQCARLEADDFASPRLGVEHAWPFAAADLDHWYRAAEEFCRASGSDGEEGGLAELAGCPDIAVLPYRFAWPTDLGAVHAAQIARSDRLRFLLDATCTRLVADGGGAQVAALRVATPGRTVFEVRARIVILAAGGIENARLLLASAEEGSLRAANRHDTVGRYYMDHPYLMPGYLVPGTQGAATGPHVIRSFKCAGREQRGHVGLALSPALRRRERLPGCAAYFINRLASETHADHFRPASRAWGDLQDAARYRLPDPRILAQAGREVLKAPLPLARTLARRARDAAMPRRLLAMRTVLETTPRRDSRVTLGTARDRLGQRLPRLDWRVNAEDRRAHDRLLALLSQAAERSGWGKLVLDPATDAQGWPVSFEGGRHHMGTTRMHADPRLGVADASGRVHGVENLYVAGSSVFTTPGVANPTLTIVALALRLADHLCRRLAA